MKIHNLAYDSEFPFVKGLTTLHELMATHHTSLASQKELNMFCAVLKEEYLLEVKYIPFEEDINTIYLQVPEGTPETKVGWLFEIFKYYTSFGVNIEIIESNENRHNLTDYLAIKYNIEKDINNLLTKTSCKIPWNKASPLLANVINASLDRLIHERKIYKVEQVGEHCFKVHLPSRIREINIEINI